MGTKENEAFLTRKEPTCIKAHWGRDNKGKE